MHVSLMKFLSSSTSKVSHHARTVKKYSNGRGLGAGIDRSPLRG